MLQDPAVTSLAHDRGLCQRLLVNTIKNNCHFKLSAVKLSRALISISGRYFLSCWDLLLLTMKKKEMGAFLLIVSIIFNCKISPAVCYKWPISIWKYSQFQCFWILSKSNNSNTVCQLLTLTCWPLFLTTKPPQWPSLYTKKRLFLRKPFLMQVSPIFLWITPFIFTFMATIPHQTM